MGNLTEHIEVVRGNVKNNRKNIAAQLASLRVQVKSAEDTLAEMDSLAAFLDAALTEPASVEKAEELRPAIVAAADAEAAALAERGE
jgi:hypothetical protein